MLFFIGNHNIRHHSQFNCLFIIYWGIVINQWQKFLYSFQCKLILFFGNLTHVIFF